MWLSLGYWLCLLLAVPAAGLLVRLFMIQHDCGHGSFLGRRAAPPGPCPLPQRNGRFRNREEVGWLGQANAGAALHVRRLPR
jgi:hypothetical protein